MGIDNYDGLNSVVMAVDSEIRINNFIEWYKSIKDVYERFSGVVLEKIKRTMEEQNISWAYYSKREKNVESLKNKVKKEYYDNDRGKIILKYSDPKNQITDFAGVRIVCYLTEDILPVCRIVESLFDVDWQNSLDKADLLDTDRIGYLSVHYVVSLKEESAIGDCEQFRGMKCEIQLRTVLQDAWSQVFHDRQYKQQAPDIEISHELERNTNLVAGTLELIDKEITSLVKEYDRLSIATRGKKEFRLLLEKPITRKNLQQYCRYKFKNVAGLFYNYDYVETILKEFKCNTIRTVDRLFTTKLVEDINGIKDQITIDKVLIYGVLIRYPWEFLGKHASKVGLSKDSIVFLQRYINVEELCEEYNLEIITK